MHKPFFFGYGSLVNRKTHDYPNTHPARVKGWRRQWRHTNLREVAYLTVEPAPDHAIDGLIAAVPGGDWAALDEREHAYDRLHLPDRDVDHAHDRDITVQIYRTRADNDAPPSTRHPVLLSYLDTVVQGYLQVFGAEGAQHFFDTTDGWESPVLDDRAAPIYTRAVTPGRQEVKLVDAALDALQVTRFRRR